MSSACDLVAEILLIIWGQVLDMYVQRNVLRFCTGSISGWNRTGRIGSATGDSRAMQGEGGGNVNLCWDSGPVFSYKLRYIVVFGLVDSLPPAAGHYPWRGIWCGRMSSQSLYLPLNSSPGNRLPQKSSNIAWNCRSGCGCSACIPDRSNKLARGRALMRPSILAQSCVNLVPSYPDVFQLKYLSWNTFTCILTSNKWSLCELNLTVRGPTFEVRLWTSISDV